ncbi:MAG: ribose-5-phosphate isomerase RpiA [Parachlamydiales bacterium]|nr:ribose-5-phosphate isomerase RpiA [Parachlamydiales bacterium]
MSQERDLAKQNAAKKAAELIEDGMIVGLGSGSTARYFIQSLIQRCHNGLKIEAVSSSLLSSAMAKDGGIPLINDSIFTKVDLYIDGADEIDLDKNLLKGGGGNLLREKIVATSSHEMIVIVDEKKIVSQLGAFGLPVEITRFGFKSTMLKISDLGFKSVLRMEDGHPFITDNGNFIVDVPFYPVSKNPHEDDEKIKSVPGVVETGFFFDIAGRIFIGYCDGHVELKSQLR